jgi:hypothetical protein
MTGRVGAIRWAMALLAVSAAAVGLPATLTPHDFYSSWPLGRSWVELLPPYNEHLIGDVGGFYVAFAILFAWAAVRPSRQLMVPLCVAWSVAAALHLVFHATHLDGFSTGDAIAEVGGLALVLALPFAALAALAAPRGARAP